MTRGQRMIGETVRVRLDDALVGRLPPVCAMTGARADGYAPMVVPRALGIAWLLLLGGPIGAAVLMGLYPRLRTRYVIQVPMSEDAFDRWMTERRRQLWCTWLGAAFVVAALAARWLGGIALLLGVGGVFLLGMASRAHWRIPWLQPSLTADALGRWVTMRGVHERFVAAITRALRR